MSLIFSFAVSLLIILFSRTMALNLFHNIELANVLKLFALALPFTTLTSIFLFTTQGFKIMKYKVMVREIMEPLGRILLVLVLLFFGWRLYGLLYAYLIPIICGTILSFYYFRKVFPQISRKAVRPIYETKKLLHFSWPVFLTEFFCMINLWIGVGMLGYFSISEEVGIYSAAHRTALWGTIIITSFSSIFAPVISDLYTRGESSKLNKYFKTVAKWTFTLNLPLSLMMIFFARDILNIFGPEFLPGMPCLVVLSLGWLVSSSTGSVSQMIAMSGRPKINLLNIIGALTGQVILNILLIPKYGILGAAFALSVSIILGNIVAVVEVVFILKMHPYRRDFYKPVLAAAVSFPALCLYAGQVSIHNTFIMFITGGLIFLALYTIILILLGVSEEERFILKKVIKKLIAY